MKRSASRLSAGSTTVREGAPELFRRLLLTVGLKIQFQCAWVDRNVGAGAVVSVTAPEGLGCLLVAVFVEWWQCVQMTREQTCQRDRFITDSQRVQSEAHCTFKLIAIACVLPVSSSSVLLEALLP